MLVLTTRCKLLRTVQWVKKTLQCKIMHMYYVNIGTVKTDMNFLSVMETSFLVIWPPKNRFCLQVLIQL